MPIRVLLQQFKTVQRQPSKIMAPQFIEEVYLQLQSKGEIKKQYSSLPYLCICDSMKKSGKFHRFFFSGGASSSSIAFYSNDLFLHSCTVPSFFINRRGSLT
jgi:hypothetical protein